MASTVYEMEISVGGVPALSMTLALHFSVHVAHPRIGIEVCNDVVIQLWSPYIMFIIRKQGK